MNKIIIVIFLIMLALAGCTEKIHVKVIPRSSSELVKLRIVSPQNGEIINSTSVRIAFEAENFDVERGDNELHFILDNGPRLTHKSKEPFFVSSLSEGRHIIRAFAAKGWGESVKDSEAFVIVQFYVKKNNSELLNTHLPMLTYNEPAGYFKGESAKRVLLDFLATNVMLSKDGYKVIYRLDGAAHELTSVSPIYLTNLAPGTHTIDLELVDKSGNLAEGNFVKTQRDIVVLEEKK